MDLSTNAAGTNISQGVCLTEEVDSLRTSVNGLLATLDLTSEPRSEEKVPVDLNVSNPERALSLELHHLTEIGKEIDRATEACSNIRRLVGD